MAILSKAGITSGSLIEASQITQIIDAFTASGSVIDISITGSLRVEGTTNLGKLGKNTQSPLIFNPDTSGESVFYVKNPSGVLTIGSGENPYFGGDLMTLSPLGTLGVVGNLNVGFTASAGSVLVSGKTGLGTSTPEARLVVSNNGSQSIEMDYSVGLNANYIESFNRSSSAPLDLVYYISPGPTGSHRFYTNGNQRMVINRDGAVGINNATPVGALDVVGTTIMRGGDLIISSSYPRLYLTDTDSNSDYSIINDNGALNIYDDTNGASRIFILPNGNVGIGTTNPLYKLSSHSASAGRVIVGNFSNDTNAGSTEVGIRLAHNNSDVCSVNLISQRVGPDAGADFSIETADSTGTLTERFRITEDGIALIGNITANNTFTTNFSSSGTVTIGTPGVNSTSHIQLWPQDAAGNAYYINDSASIFNIGNGVFDGGGGTNMISVGGSFGVAIRKTFTNGSAALDVNGDTIITGSLTTTSNAVISGSLTTTSNAVISGSLTTKSNAVISGSTIIRSTENEVLKAIGGNSSVSAIVAQGGQPSFTLKDQSGVERWTIFKPVTTNNLSFWNGSAVVLSLQSGGNIGIGTNNITPATKLDVRSSEANDVLFASNTNASFTNACLVTNTSRAAGTNCFFIYALANTAPQFQVFNNGDVVNANNSYGLLSDIKLKENIIDTTPKLNKLMQVRIVNYNLKESLGYEPIKQLGVIAQELEEIFPGLVENTSDRNEKGKELKTSTKSVKMSIFVPILIKAVQEQQAQIEELKLQVATLISGSI